MWIQLSSSHPRPVPVLTIIDASTKLMAVRVLNSEQTDDFISALERGQRMELRSSEILELRPWYLP